MRKIGLISLSLISLVALSSQALSANLVTGVSGCIMKSGGSVGYGQAGGPVWATIREPASGDYADQHQSWIFSQGHTFWISSASFSTRKNGTDTSYSAPHFVQWGSIPFSLRPSGFKNPFTGTRKEGARVGESLGWAGTDDKVYGIGIDGWYYKRGEYRGYFTGLKVAYFDDLYGNVMTGNVYGVYREKPGWVAVPENTVFETCSSASNASNGNWINNQFVTSNEMNNAFDQFKTNIDTKINEKKINLSLLSTVIASTASVSTKEASSSSAFFTGVRNSHAQKDVVGSSSRDATFSVTGFH